MPTREDVDVHVHRSPVRLPDGTEIVAASFDPTDPSSREPTPQFGLYFDARWSPPWTHEHVDWPDFGVPVDREALRTALLDVLGRARAGQRVEIGCLGGHGRTGTALACLAVLAGGSATDAVAWVRQHHCEHAVETPDQEAFVRGFASV